MTDIKHLHQGEGEGLNSNIIDFEAERWRRAEQRQALPKKWANLDRLPFCIDDCPATRTYMYGPGEPCKTCTLECPYRGK